MRWPQHGTSYEAAEAQHRGDAKSDIVMVGSDSIETVRTTHASYFDRASETSAVRFSASWLRSTAAAASEFSRLALEYLVDQITEPLSRERG